MTVTEPSAAPAARPTIVQGLGILVAVVVAIGIFSAIGHALTLDTQMYAGFLFLLYWAGIQHGAWDALPAALVGALTGVLIGWCVHMLPVLLPGAGGTLLLAAIILTSMYLLIVNGAPLFINYATMLLLTVAATPLITDTPSAVRAGAAVLAAAVYAAALLALIGRLTARAKA